MSYWNHRIIQRIRKSSDSEEACYQVHEVHYDDSGNIHSWTKDAVTPSGETLDDLKREIEHHLKALSKPVLIEVSANGKEVLQEVVEGS